MATGSKFLKMNKENIHLCHSSLSEDFHGNELKKERKEKKRKDSENGI